MWGDFFYLLKSKFICLIISTVSETYNSNEISSRLLGSHHAQSPGLLFYVDGVNIRAKKEIIFAK